MPNSDIIVHAESSILGWGITDGKNPSGGRWKAYELNDINVLELKGILIRVMAYCKDKAYEHVRIMSDKKQHFLTFLIWSIWGRANQNHAVKL